MRPLAIVENPPLLPGECFRCKAGVSPNRKYFLDTGLDIEYVGVLYLCNTCLTDIVLVCPDFFTKAEMDSLSDSMNDIITTASAEAEKHEKVISSLSALGFDVEKVLEKAAALSGNELAVAEVVGLKNNIEVLRKENDKLLKSEAIVTDLHEQIEGLLTKIREINTDKEQADKRIRELEATVTRLSTASTEDNAAAATVFSEMNVLSNASLSLVVKDTKNGSRTADNATESELNSDSDAE